MLVSNTIAKLSIYLLIITSIVHKDDVKSFSVIVTAWIYDLQLSKTLFDSNVMIDLISQLLVNKINPWPLVFHNDHLYMSLANDNLITLTEYIKI